ncbi:MAG: hypothetical protein K2N34_01760 [Lachnospiraceae bacterium]|nr:hypothetical protein [Lachnospiraceae bacterium]
MLGLLRRLLTVLAFCSCFSRPKAGYGKVDGAFSLELLKQAPFPDDLTALGADEIR